MACSKIFMEKIPLFEKTFATSWIDASGSILDIPKYFRVSSRLFSNGNPNATYVAITEPIEDP